MGGREGGEVSRFASPRSKPWKFRGGVGSHYPLVRSCGSMISFWKSACMGVCVCVWASYRFVILLRVPVVYVPVTDYSAFIYVCCGRCWFFYVRCVCESCFVFTLAVVHGGLGVCSPPLYVAMHFMFPPPLLYQCFLSYIFECSVAVTRKNAPRDDWFGVMMVMMPVYFGFPSVFCIVVGGFVFSFGVFLPNVYRPVAD